MAMLTSIIKTITTNKNFLAEIAVKLLTNENIKQRLSSSNNKLSKFVHS